MMTYCPGSALRRKDAHKMQTQLPVPALRSSQCVLPATLQSTQAQCCGASMCFGETLLNKKIVVGNRKYSRRYQVATSVRVGMGREDVSVNLKIYKSSIKHTYSIYNFLKLCFDCHANYVF